MIINRSNDVMRMLGSEDFSGMELDPHMQERARQAWTPSKEFIRTLGIMTVPIQGEQ